MIVFYVEDFGVIVCGFYDVFGFKVDVDFMVWLYGDMVEEF